MKKKPNKRKTTKAKSKSKYHAKPGLAYVGAFVDQPVKDILRSKAKDDGRSMQSKLNQILRKVFKIRSED